jgi:hypothetical protein
MAILLIWQDIPKTTSCFVVQPDASIVPDLLQAAGQYINGGGETEAVEKVSKWLTTEEGKACQSLSSSELIEGFFTQVVICGFLL